MRAMWSGAIAFGLVNVPVKLYAATEKHDIAFRQIHAADAGRIRYERRCDVCNEVVEYAQIEKAYDDGEHTVVVTDEDLKSLPAEAKDEIEVVQFVPGEQIDPIMLDTPYYLEPVGKSPKSYALLRQTLVSSALTAVVKFTLRSKTRLGVLRARGDVLVLQTLLWAEDIRAADFPALATDITVSDKELQMAQLLVEQFSGDFHPEEFEDSYQAELRQLIDAKLEQGDAIDTAATFGTHAEDETSSSGKVVSLLDALEASLKKRGAAATEPQAADTDEPPAEPAPAKKAAAKKTAKKAPVKRKSA